MKRTVKLLVVFMAATMLTSCLAFTPPTAKADATTRTLTVPDDFPTIREALSNATAGDTVFVRAGNYTIPPNGYTYELEIPNSVSLIGENSQNTVIETTQIQRTLFGWNYGILLNDDSSISGFTITGNANVIALFGNGKVTDNIINLTGNGRYAIETGSGTISSNIINYVNSEPNSNLESVTNGINTETRANTIISNNMINGFGIGIWVSGILGKSRVVILNNTLTNNNIGIKGVTPVLLQGNNIVNSTAYALYGMFNTNATYNWWGTTDAQTISSLITIGKSTNITVTFIPFLTEPNPQAIPIQNGIISPTSTPTVPEYPLAAIAFTVFAVTSSILYIRRTKAKLAEARQVKQ